MKKFICSGIALLTLCSFSYSSDGPEEGKKFEHFNELPQELQVHILSHLGLQDLYNALLISKGLKPVAEEAFKNRLVILQQERPLQITPVLLDKLATSSAPIRERIVNIQLADSFPTPMSNSQITDSSLEKLKQFPNLSELHLSQCTKITDLGLQHLPKSLKTLSLQDCKGITSVGFEYLKGIPLEMLNLGLTKITDADLSNLPESLTLLDLHGCSGIHDAGLETIQKCCPKLVTLNLSICRGITNDGFQYLPKTLTALILRSTNINSIGLKHIQALPDIKKLDLAHCLKLSNTDLANLPQGLVILNLSNTNVGDAGLENLSTLKDLRQLVIKDCRNINNAGTEKLQEELPDLKIIRE